MPRRYHRGMARQCTRGHDGTKPGKGADDMLASHHTHQHQISPRGRAKQLETNIKVAMADIQGAGGDGADGIEGVIDQISRTGRSAIARSIDWHPSRRLTLVQVIGIKRGGGEPTQSPEQRARGRREVSGGSDRSV
jgi:hypothetical protein